VVADHQLQQEQLPSTRNQPSACYLKQYANFLYQYSHQYSFLPIGWKCYRRNSHWLAAGVTGSFSAGVFTISGTPTVAGPFNYTVTSTGVCTAVTSSGTITISPAATVVRSSAAGTDAQTRCTGAALTNITYTLGGSATDATVTGLPTGVTGTYNSVTKVFTISGTPTAPASGAYSYTVTATGGCGSPVATGTITVNTQPTISLLSGSSTQTSCISTAISTVSYQLGGSATGATVTGLPAGVTGSFSAGVFTISGTPTVAGPFNYTVTSTGVCTAVTSSGTITISPAATVVRSSAAGTDAQTRCTGAALTNITYTLGGSATDATVTGLPTGVTGTYNSVTKVFTISGTPTAPASGAYSYTVNRYRWLWITSCNRNNYRQHATNHQPVIWKQYANFLYQYSHQYSFLPIGWKCYTAQQSLACQRVLQEAFLQGIHHQWNANCCRTI
jgi:hypothetical protein